jgi:hypothetical protein
LANKKDVTFNLPSDSGHDFTEQKHVLTYKPKIKYEEPAQKIDGYPSPPRVEDDAIQQATQRLKDLINGYAALEHLTEIAQQKVDKRVEEGGGLDVQLDPQKDAYVIAALKRCFPEATDHTKISYQMYQNCLARVNAQAVAPGINPVDVIAAKNNPLQTDFGGKNKPAGSNRTEIAAPSGVKPVDLEAFQSTAVIALFALLLPLISQKNALDIFQHLTSAPHS